MSKTKRYAVVAYIGETEIMRCVCYYKENAVKTRDLWQKNGSFSRVDIEVEAQ